MTTGALARVISRPVRTGSPERCELCAAPLAASHRHVLDELGGRDDALLCCCQACAILFERDAAGGRHYRLVPQRRRPVPGQPARQLGCPVGLAFFVAHDDGSVVARHPSPLGTTRWDVDRDDWTETVSGCPELGDLQPRVEALLVNTTGGADESWIVPLDDCYRLVAALRQAWTGFTGGDAARQAITAFFSNLNRTDRRKHG